MPAALYTRAATPADLSRGLDLLVRPHIVFLLICLVYVSFPSMHFNADALHYNLHAFLCAQEPSRLLEDSSVPAHIAWHFLAVSVLAVFKPETPEQSLYLLGQVNIALALGSIFLFMRIVGSYAGRLMTAWATLVLAFSYAFLKYSVTLEVYSLNNLVLGGVLLAVCATLRRRESPTSPWLAVGLAGLTAAALAAHVANVLVVPPLLALLLRGGIRQGLRHTLVYAATLILLFAAGLLGLALFGGQDLRGVLRFLFSYRVDTGAYLDGGVLASLLAAPRLAADAVMHRHGFWLYPAAILFIIYGARRWSRLKGDPWIAFLAFYVVLVGLYGSVWDPTNLEHKVALIAPSILLITSVFHRLGERPRPWARAGAWLLALGVVGLGVKDGLLPYADLRGYPPYRISSEIHTLSSSSKVLVVADRQRLQVPAVTLASMTFFGQQVEILDPDAPGLEEKIRRCQGSGFEVLWLGVRPPAPVKARPPAG